MRALRPAQRHGRAAAMDGSPSGMPLSRKNRSTPVWPARMNRVSSDAGGAVGGVGGAARCARMRAGRPPPLLRIGTAVATPPICAPQ